MKKLSIAVIIAGAMILSACSGNTNSQDSSDSTASISSTDTNMNAMNNADTSQVMVGTDAQDFTKDAASGGLFEVELGAIAQRNGSSQAVKNFGKMMVDDHTQLNQELHDLADKKNVPLPDGITGSQQGDTTKLGKEKGSDFDKDYISMMVKDHEDDIDAFKKAGDNIKNQDYKDFITKALPVLQKHLEAAKAIKAKM